MVCDAFTPLPPPSSHPAPPVTLCGKWWGQWRVHKAEQCRAHHCNTRPGSVSCLALHVVWSILPHNQPPVLLPGLPMCAPHSTLYVPEGVVSVRHRVWYCKVHLVPPPPRHTHTKQPTSHAPGAKPFPFPSIFAIRVDAQAAAQQTPHAPHGVSLSPAFARDISRPALMVHHTALPAALHWWHPPPAAPSSV
jgi:hypothetical protein